METNFYNIDEKINLIYNFLYNEVDTSCYSVDNIDQKAITIDDIKIGIKHKDVISELLESFKQGVFQISHMNKDDVTLRLKRFSDNNTMEVLINPYKKNLKHDSLTSNRDSLFSYILSKLVLDNKTSSILLPIINFDVQFDSLLSIFKQFKIETFYNEKINSDEITDIFSIGIREMFNKGFSLDTYLSKNELNYKYLLFQIIHCLAIIQKEHPNFQHNMLNLKNVMIYPNLNDIDKNYKYDNDFFNLKDLDFKIKIFNFSKAESKQYPNDKISNKNSYVDLYSFLKSFYKFNKFKGVDQETFEFLDKIFLNNYKNNGDSKEFFKPEKLLEDKYFRSLKVNENSTEKKSSKQEYMNRNSKDENIFMTNLDSDSRSVLGFQSETEEKIKRTEISKKSTKKLTRKIKSDQEGGNRHHSSPYNKIKNDPFLSNDAKNVNTRRRDEMPPPKEPPILAEQKIYDRPAKKQEAVLPQMYPPAHIPVPNPYYPHMNPQYAYGYKPNQIPVQKYYNITLSNPVGNHTSINRVYEDMLPGDDREYTLQSVFERRQLNNYLRSLILEVGDGEEMSISATNKRTLLSHIRLIELNPYNIMKNPYHSLSKGFLLYSSAFPIRYDQEKDNLSIAKRSTGINVRIYELSEGAIRSNKLNDQLSKFDFDVWREIRFYEFIREDIIKKKVCPNFVSLYLFTIDTESRIDYNKLDLIKYKNQPKGSLSNEIANNNLINRKHHIDPLQFLMLNSYGIDRKATKGDEAIKVIEVDEETGKNIAKYLYKNKYMVSIRGKQNEYSWTEHGIKFLGNKNFFNLVDNESRPYKDKKVTAAEIKILANIIGKQDLTASSFCSLVALTEAPNNNILKWASPLSESYGAVKKQVETGYHTPNVWKSILFQLVYTCAVLQENNILFHKFSLENNFFVKDLYSNKENRTHWIYKVDEFDFYIPNYGYLLMFDSKFVDIEEYEGNSIYEPIKNNKQKFKINSKKLFGDKNNNNFDNSLVHLFFKQLINPDNLRINLEKISGEQPDQEVLDLLKNMYDDKSSENIRDYLKKYFTFFMNNRIGTLLSREERDNLALIRDFNFTVGEIVAYEEKYEVFKWGVISDFKDSKIEIIIDPNGGKREVGMFSLNKYPENETIKQISKNNISYDSNFTIEIYNLDNKI